MKNFSPNKAQNVFTQRKLKSSGLLVMALVGAAVVGATSVTKECYEYLDNYINVYKLTGKAGNLELLKKIFDYYILCKDIDNIFDVIYGPAVDHFRCLFPDIKLNPKVLPSYLFECECKNCFNGCDICSKLFNDLLQSNS